MKQKRIALLALLFLAIWSTAALAAEQNNMAGMEMNGDMIMLNTDTVDGVKAMVHLINIREKMAKIGMDATHHFMVMFTDATTGAQLDKGLVALKITGPTGGRTKPLKLMSMAGSSFGADISLPEKGAYGFEVAAKLQDGKKRRFHFKYTVR